MYYNIRGIWIWKLIYKLQQVKTRFKAKMLMIQISVSQYDKTKVKAVVVFEDSVK